MFDAWNADPYEATIEDPADGQPRQLVITGHDVVAGLFTAMYDDSLIPLLPSLLAPLLARDPLADVVVEQLATSGIETLDRRRRRASLGAVDCADRDRLAGRPDAEVIAAEPFYAGLVVFGVHACDLWDVEPVDASFNDPVSSDVPSLFLGDEYDPVTPPTDTERAAGRFANGPTSRPPARPRHRVQRPLPDEGDARLRRRPQGAARHRLCRRHGAAGLGGVVGGAS